MAKKKQQTARKITLSTGAIVLLAMDIRPGVHGILLTSAQGNETNIAISEEALGALMVLLLTCGKTWQVA